MFTAFVIASFGTLYLVCLILWGVCLARGLKWARAADITWRRVLLAMVLTVLFQLGWESVLGAIAAATPTRTIEALTWLGLIGSVALSWLAILIVFRTRILQTLQAWLVTLIPAIILLPLLLLVWRPFFFEAYVSPTNAMAPTLLGHHWRGVCSTCGKPNYASANTRPPALLHMICDDFHVDNRSDADELEDTVHWADRFLVAKFLKPKRWDVVAFRYPGNDQQKYVMRLVGMPGETIEIREGSVWANGKRLEMPSHLKGLRYVSELPGSYQESAWASPDHPAVLEEAQYFMLGDFSVQSFDSRFWPQGAGGAGDAGDAPPYAVPESHLLGVVTHIYWPPWRLRSFAD